ncbi:MAG TPA: STAS domain-containing protein [Candidatus Acidoferrum sp.]|nr:STAS domain-containing protein [Candidatus Acidoferrum sp.]
MTQKIHSVLYSSLPMECIRLEITKQTISNDEVTVMHLGGMLSLETINQFLQLVRPEPALHLVLEMAGVTFLDSAGVGALMQLFVHRKSQRQKLSRAELAPQGKAVVEVGVY